MTQRTYVRSTAAERACRKKHLSEERFTVRKRRVAGVRGAQLIPFFAYRSDVPRSALAAFSGRVVTRAKTLS